jgi:hypothetical protein
MIFYSTFHWHDATREQQHEAARRYAGDLFNWCAVQRDYPYSHHPEPKPDMCLFWAFNEIKERVLREFNRSNPGHEVCAN